MRVQREALTLLNRTLPNRNLLYRKLLNRNLPNQETARRESAKPYSAKPESAKTLHMWTSMYPGYATSTAWAEGNVVVIYNDLAPFSSDKIRAKILDLGYGGARHEPSIT